MLLSECLDAFEPNQRTKSKILTLLTKKMTMVGHSVICQGVQVSIPSTLQSALNVLTPIPEELQDVRHEKQREIVELKSQSLKDAS